MARRDQIDAAAQARGLTRAGWLSLAVQAQLQRDARLPRAGLRERVA